MNDCNHWIPIILEETREELEESRRAHQRDKRTAQNALNDIRAIVNCAEAKLGARPLTSEQRMQELYSQAVLRQAEAMSQAGRPYSPLSKLGDPRQQSCDHSPWSGLFGSIFVR